MTMDERGKRWMAYMDGQMSASEALEFERSLSPEDQKRLNDEVRLEAAICDSLSGPECCPVALWNTLTLRMKNQTPKPGRLVVWQRRFVAAAAAIAIMTTSTMIYRELVPNSRQNVARGVEITEDNEKDFASHTEVPGDREALQRYFNDKHFDLKLLHANSAKLDSHHPIKLLGACAGNCPKGSLIEIRLTCCDRLVKLLIAKEGSRGAKLIRRSQRCGTVRTSRVVDGYVTALVGDIHGNNELLDLIQPAGGDII